jgi:hypothetical protein
MLVAALKRSIAFCTAALVTATDAKLGDMVLYYRHSSPTERNGLSRSCLSGAHERESYWSPSRWTSAVGRHPSKEAVAGRSDDHS